MDLPVKGKFIEQINVKIDRETKERIEFLRSKNYDVVKIIRPAVIEAVERAIRIAEGKSAS